MIRNMRAAGIAALVALSCTFCANAQQDPDLKAILSRLEKVEKDNQLLKEEVRALKKELAENHSTSAGPSVAERVEVQEQRTADLAQTKVEASQRMPISLTGMLLFNAFLNGKYSGTSEYPVTAALNPLQSSSGASLRQTVLGLKFNGPDLPWGGTASGSVYMDFYAGSREPSNNLLHIRTATLDLNWKNTTVTVGQDKPIFAPREPDSMAQVAISPLTGAGNLWDWQPQGRIEQRFHFGQNAGFRAQAGVYMTSESDATVPAAFTASIEHTRPGYEGRFEFWRGASEKRIEIAPGFHVSTTHVAGTTVPSRLVSLDWLVRPAHLVQFTGAWFLGENVANTGGLRASLTVLSAGNAIPVHSSGGWGQAALFLTPRLTFHFQLGAQQNRDIDLRGSGINQNFVYAGNLYYRLASNIIASFEASQARTNYLTGGLRLNNHYDLALAYLF